MAFIHEGYNGEHTGVSGLLLDGMKLKSYSEGA